jgi:hypothetical protein
MCWPLSIYSLYSYNGFVWRGRGKTAHIFTFENTVFELKHSKHKNLFQCTVLLISEHEEKTAVEQG